MVKVEDTNHTVKEVLFLAGCHPVFRNDGVESFTINGNYPVIARQIVMERSGALNTLFLQGCGGDINPLYDDLIPWAAYWPRMC